MPIDNLSIVGAGGHACVVIDALLTGTVITQKLVIVDDNLSLVGQSILGFPVLGPVCEIVRPGDNFHSAVGNNATRCKLFEKLSEFGALPYSVFHSSSHISRFASIGRGCFMAAGSILAPRASVGHGVIINHGAVVDHDCQLGNFVHVAPLASLAGAVQVGHQALIGAGARVLPGVCIGHGAVVGAGAVVVKDVQPGSVVVGTPAHPLLRSESDS